MARPLKYEGRDLHLALFGGPKLRDAYTGITPPAVAEVREPMRIVHMRRTGNAVLLEFADEHNVVTNITVSTPDDPRMQAFPVAERNRVYSALSALYREGGPADAA